MVGLRIWEEIPLNAFCSAASHMVWIRHHHFIIYSVMPREGEYFWPIKSLACVIGSNFRPWVWMLWMSCRNRLFVWKLWDLLQCFWFIWCESTNFHCGTKICIIHSVNVTETFFSHFCHVFSFQLRLAFFNTCIEIAKQYWPTVSEHDECD